MPDAADTAIAALRGRDATAYRAARAAKFAAESAYEQASRAIGDAGRADYRTLTDVVRRALAPHRIEWRNEYPPRWGASDVDGLDWTCSVHLGGTIWPQAPGRLFAVQMRAHLDFSVTPRDGAELRAMLAALKAAADALARGLYGEADDAAR